MTSARFAARTFLCVIVLLIWIDRSLAGAQTFSRIDYGASSLTFGIATGDLNGDHKDDIVQSTTTGLSIYLTTGAGFTTTVLAGTCYGAAIGDVTGDSSPDIVAACSTGLLIIGGHGSNILDAPQIIPFSIPYKVVAIGDMDKDGRNDIVGAAGRFGNPETRLSIFRNNNKTPSGFVESNISQILPLDPSSIALADFDGDGFLDVFIADQRAYVVPIRFGGTPYFGQKPIGVMYFADDQTHYTYFLDIGDYDGGGTRDDLAILTENSTGLAGHLTVCSNLGRGNCTMSLTADERPVGMASAPFAGSIATAVLSANVGRLSVGAFSTSPGAVYRMAIGDFDGDGRMDIAIGYQFGHGLTVLTNTTVSAGTATSVVAGAFDNASVSLHGFPAAGTWTEGGQTIASGASPTVTLGVGAHTLTYSVGGSQSTVTVTVTADPTVHLQSSLNTANASLAAANASLAAANAQVTSLANQVTSLTDQVANFSAQLTSANQTTAAQTAAIADRDATIAAQAASITTLTSANGSLATDKGALQAALTTANSTIATQTAAIADRDATIASQTATIGDRDVTIATQTASINALTSTNAALTTDKAVLQASVASANATIANQIATIADRDAAVAAQTALIADRDATIAAQGTSIDTLTSASASLAADKAGLQAALTAANSTIATQTATIADRDATIATQTASISTLTSDKAALQASVTTANATIAGQAATINALTSANATLTSNKTALQASLTSANATIATQTASVASLTSQVTSLQQQVASLSAATSTISQGVSTIQTLLGTSIAGTTPIAQLQTLVAAIQTMNNGAQQQLTKSLRGGK